MAELTDAQKVLRNDTGKRIAAAIEALGGTPPINLGMTGATPGQVPIINTVDENGAPTSYRPGSGGGGTSDYDDLTDKPSINNVTLSGNKTAAELGLGTYSKPSGGIPKSDLASAVQTSLGLADSALQSVPSTYRTAAAQDAIDAAQDEQIEAISHRNLLDNWYFVGGGSQNGDGVFPINQRGQTSYPNAGYTIDRWRTSNSALTVTLNSNYVDISNSNASTRYGFEYYVKSPNSLRGKTLTASFIMPDGTLKSGTANIPATIPASNTNLNVFNFGENSTFRIEVRVDGDIKTMLLIGANETISITAVKLEIGSYQTLAHNEGTDANPNWVLNELPDYGEELAKCQRYYIKFDRYIASGFLTNSGKEYNMPIYLPITMAGTPTATMSGYVARTPNGYSAHTGGNWTAPTSLGVYFPNNGFVLLADTINSAVDTNNIQINYYIKDLALTV